MNRNKVFKWLYSLFMLMPLIAIGVTCAYVIFNKNAYQSYEGYEKQTNTEIATDIESGLDYQLSYGSYAGGMTFSQPVKVENLVVDTSYSSASNWFAQHINEVGYITYTTISNVYQLRLYDDNMTSLDYWQTNYGNSYWFISFTAQSNATLTNNDILYRVYEQQVGNSLDNAFYYAVNTFNESGFNKVDFVSFFDFLYDSPNVWTTFANTYINYSMFVTLCFFLPSVLLWFVNFSYKLVDGFSNKVMR